MRVSSALAVLGLLCAAASAAAQTPAPATERALRRLECEWSAALVRRDPTVLRRLQAPEFTVVYFEGTISDREDDIGALASGSVQLSSVRLGEIRVRVYGNTAVVLSRFALVGTVDGEDLGGTYVQTNTWVRGEAGWRVVASQHTRVQALDPSSVRVDDECADP